LRTDTSLSKKQTCGKAVGTLHLKGEGQNN
jgi:hypothetical protein